MPSVGRCRALLVAFATCWMLASTTTRSAADGTLQARIVAVKSSDLALYDDVIAGFGGALGVRVDVLTLPTDGGEVRRLVESLTRVPPALILTLGANATTLVHRELPDIPVVYARVLNPVGSGSSSENLTGVRQLVPARSQLDLLERLAPRTARVGIPYDPDRSAAWVAEAETAAREAGMKTVRIPAVNKADAADALAAATSGGDPVDALWVSPDRTWINPDTVPLLLRTAHEKRLPLLVHAAQLVGEGALAAVYVDDRALGRRAAELARRILHGEPAAQIAVADPPESIAINSKVAAELGLPIPADLAARAAKVLR